MPKYSNLFGSQYGEEEILEPFFHGQEKGFVVDVGAADGCVNSNTAILLAHNPDWSGVLIEPDPTQYEALSQNYYGRSNVKCFRYGVMEGEGKGSCMFYSAGQVSTFSTVWRSRCEEIHKLHFTRVFVQTRTLTQVLQEANAPRVIDFLSIDCEQLDQEVFDSLDHNKYLVRLLCMEGTGHRVPGYRYHDKTHGNTFYVKDTI